jgi:predicted NAD/FAD-dependent oxidoreductase
MLLGLIPSYAQATTTCNWDSMAGWVARENMKVGSKSWAQSIPVKMSADFSRRKMADRVEGYFSTTSLSCESTEKNYCLNFSHWLLQR